MSLTAEQILQVKTRLREIFVPEWGGSVWIRPLTLEEQNRVADLATKFAKATYADRARNLALEVIRWCVIDENEQPVFSKEQIQALWKKDASPAGRVQDAIMQFSGLTPEAREELEKNLLPAMSDKPDS